MREAVAFAIGALLAIGGMLLSPARPTASSENPLCIVDAGMSYQEKSFVLFYCDNEPRQFRIVGKDLIERLDKASGPLWMRKSEIR